jgi:hypothetical protein
MSHPKTKTPWIHGPSLQSFTNTATKVNVTRPRTFSAIPKGFLGQDDASYLRYVAFFRAQLLLEWGQYREALAWACQECEFYPDRPSSHHAERINQLLLKNPPFVLLGCLAAYE